MTIQLISTSKIKFIRALPCTTLIHEEYMLNEYYRLLPSCMTAAATEGMMNKMRFCQLVTDRIIKIRKTKTT